MIKKDNRNIIQFEWRKGKLTKINKRETDRRIFGRLKLEKRKGYSFSTDDNNMMYLV
jgi:hypothetical protein